MENKSGINILIKVMFTLIISLIILIVFSHYFMNQLYVQRLSEAEQYGLHTDEVQYQESFTNTSFYGTLFIDTYFNVLKNLMNNSSNIDLPLPLQIDEEFFKNPSPSILSLNSETEQNVRQLDAFPQELQKSLVEFENFDRSSVFEPGAPLYDSSFRTQMFNTFILNILITEVDNNDLDLKLKSLVDLINILLNEKPNILPTVHTLSKVNKYVDLIYLLYLLDKIDSRTAIHYLDEVQSLPINQSIKNAIKAEYYFVFNRVNQTVLTNNNPYIPAFQFNMVYVIERYIKWIENYDTPYYQLDGNLKEDNPFPFYVFLANNYSYKWHEILYQRDILYTRVILLKTAIQFDEETKSAEQFIETSKVVEPISGKLPLINQLNTLTVVHSSELTITEIKPQINLFDNNYGKDDLYFITNADTEAP